MPHLNRIGLTNFRVFKKRTELALAPITILTGTNSSGKSSVLKAFQLLQENIKDIGYLNFSEGEHKLGNFELALNRDAQNKTITFIAPIDLGFNQDKLEDIYADLVYQLDESNDLKFGKLIRLSICLEKNKQEIIGVTPWDSLDIDFEYFHRERVLNYNLGLLKYFRYAFEIFDIQDAPKNIEELRLQSADFLTYSKSAIELVKQIYQSNDATQKEKLLKFFEEEFPKDFDLFQVSEEFMIQSFEKPEDDRFSQEFKVVTMRGGLFLFDLPESILKHQIRLMFQLDTSDEETWELINPTNSRRNSQYQTLNKIEFTEYVYSVLLSVKEKLKEKYKFENCQELSLLIFDTYYKEECDNNDISYNSGLMKGFLKSEEENGQGKPDLSGFLGILQIPYYGFHRFIKRDNIIRDTYLTIYKEDKYEFLSDQLFGNKKDKFHNKIGIHPKVANILTHAFKENGYHSVLRVFKNDNFHYLEAVRANTQRLYTFQSQGTSFNKLLLNFIKKNDEVQILYINKWLKELGIAEELKIEVNNQGIGVSISIDGQSLADLGYGITQLLPILIRLATITDCIWQAPDPDNENGWDYYDKRILYIEEPETNLHPKLQSKLADIFVEACETMKIQLIIETHSEYLIRKLQYLTAKKIITPEMTVIHYFYDPKEERPEGEPQVKQINIQSDGRLTGQFGSGFYDESARLMTAILTGETLN